MNYVKLKKFLDNRACQQLINFQSIQIVPEPLGLLDGDDMTNTWYESKRSPGLSYRYSTDKACMSIASGIMRELLDITGIDFSGGINDRCLPFCKYGDGGVIKAHRDIDKVKGLTEPVEYVVICMLTQVGIDFGYIVQDSVSADGLFINLNPLKVSKNGKEVVEDYPHYPVNRYYPNLQKGDVIIFRNDNSIHGVDPISVHSGQLGRITCGFRSR